MKGFYLNLFFLICGIITCRGNPTESLTPFVVGGVEVEPHSFPSQVYLTQSYTADVEVEGLGTYAYSFSFACGGTLVNKTHILTAAHCINHEYEGTLEDFGIEVKIPIVPNKYYPAFESTFKVYAGAHNISFVGNDTIHMPKTVKVLDVIEVYTHPKYDHRRQTNDIALFRITPVEETKEIKYAYLPEKSTEIPRVGQIGLVIGWGDTREGAREGSNVLMKTDIDILDMDEDCKDYPASSELQICAGYLPGGKDSCQGDSGGGFYVKDDTTNKLLTVGVVSYGIGCARPGIPGIYTRVSAYMDWIRYSIP